MNGFTSSYSTKNQMESVLRIARKLEKIMEAHGLSEEDIPDMYDHLDKNVDRTTGEFDVKAFREYQRAKKKERGKIKTIVS